MTPGRGVDSGSGGSADGFRQGNGNPQPQFLLRLADIRNVAISGGAGIGLAQDMHGFFRRQDAAHQMREGGDANHLIGAHVVGLPGSAVLEQGEEPMSQVALVEVGAVAGDGDGIGREGIADEVPMAKCTLSGGRGLRRRCSGPPRFPSYAPQPTSGQRCWRRALHGQRQCWLRRGEELIIFYTY